MDHAGHHECACSYTWWNTAQEIPNEGKKTPKPRVVVSPRTGPHIPLLYETTLGFDARQRALDAEERDLAAQQALEDLFE